MFYVFFHDANLDNNKINGYDDNDSSKWIVQELGRTQQKVTWLAFHATSQHYIDLDN